MGSPKGLSWTPAQLAIYQLLKAGGYDYDQISAQVGIDKSVITKVKKAMHGGQAPPADKLGDNMPENLPTKESIDTSKEVVKELAQKTASTAYELKSKAAMPGIATQFKFINVPLVCPITPIMLNARFVAQKEWGWRSDMPWENFFDTILYLYCKACGITLQGYIIDQEIEEKESGEPSPAPSPEKAGGNGFDINELAVKVAQVLLAMSKNQ